MGAVLEVDPSELESVHSILEAHGLTKNTHLIGETNNSQLFTINLQTKELFSSKLSALNATWSEMTYQMQAKRDNPECAEEAYQALRHSEDSGLLIQPSYDAEAERKSHAERFNIGGTRPRIAVLREQGTNGQNEMAFAFDRAGFESVDVHMTDLISGTVQLNRFSGLVACGGFSYGDVLGAGSGWAKSILYNTALKDQFSDFFARADSFSLGVCNGCQMLAQLKDIIPGAEPGRIFRNRSEQFEARYTSVEVQNAQSLLSGMSDNSCQCRCAR